MGVCGGDAQSDATRSLSVRTRKGKRGSLEVRNFSVLSTLRRLWVLTIPLAFCSRIVVPLFVLFFDFFS